MQSRDHVVSLFSRSIVTFPKTLPYGIHELGVPLLVPVFRLFFARFVDSIGLVECCLAVSRLFTYFQSEFQSIQRLTRIAVRHIGQEGDQVWRKMG